MGFFFLITTSFQSWPPFMFILAGFVEMSERQEQQLGAKVETWT